MQYVGRLMSSVYNTITPNINPSTLTGAIDVIVVEREVEVEEPVTLPDGTTTTNKRSTTELASSPFHVRFGKMSVLRPGERKVTLHLNDSPDPIPFAMKVGENGEAFFVMKVENPEEHVPDALVTSPVVGPLSNPLSSVEPVPLDLGESCSANAGADEPAATTETSGPTQADTTGATAAAPSLTEPRPSTPPMQLQPAFGDEPVSEMNVTPVELDLDMEGYKLSNSNRQVALRQGQRLAGELPLNKQHGGRNPLILSERLDQPNLRWQHHLVNSISKLVMPSRSGATSEQRNASTRPRRLSDTSLMVPVDHDESSPLSLPTTKPSSSSPSTGLLHLRISRSDSALYAHAMAQQAGDAILPGVHSPAMVEASEAVNENPNEEDAVGTLTCAQADPYLFQLRVDDNTVYSFELSLCWIPAAGASDTVNAEYLFDEGRVSFQRFLEDDSIIQDPRLCIRHNDSYHYRESEHDMFSTLAFYRDILIRSSSEVPAVSTKASVWRRLWSRPEPRLPAERVSSVADESQAPSDVGRAAAGKSRASAPPSLTSNAATTVAVAGASTSPVPENGTLAADVAEAGDEEAAGAAAATEPVVTEEPSAAQPDTYVKTLRLSSDQLKQLGLRKGTNTITFSVTSSYSGVATCRARIFLWDCDQPVVVSDIDGTITKSDALGHVFTLMGRDWTHLGVAKLYHDIAKNGYRLMYLTSRAIGQADITRDYLRNINQNNYQLPDGPVIMSPDRLIASLHREVILRKPEVFKMACLRDIARLFGIDPSQPDSEHRTPFYAGFGNRITDALSYRSVNIPSSRIFTIDSNGEVKMELLELAGYHTSYPNMTDLVDQMFPPVPKMKRNEHIAAYTDFNYWRDELADVELPPDEELVPVVSPSSPQQRGLRSPKQKSSKGERQQQQQQPQEKDQPLLKTQFYDRSPSSPSSLVSSSPRSSSSDPSLSAPALPPSEKPSRFRRLLGLSRRRRPADSTTPASSEPRTDDIRPRSLDLSDGSLSPPSLPGLSSSWSERHILSSDDDDDDDNAVKTHDQQRTYASLYDEPGDESDEPVSPEARRRQQRRQQLLYGSSSLSFDKADPPRHFSDSAPLQMEDEDPLLASGDIQFEWRG